MLSDVEKMSDVENMLSDDEFLVDTGVTLKEDVGQHRKREYLKGVISKKKVYLLGGKNQ